MQEAHLFWQCDDNVVILTANHWKQQMYPHWGTEGPTHRSGSCYGSYEAKSGPLYMVVQSQQLHLWRAIWHFVCCLHTQKHYVTFPWILRMVPDSGHKSTFPFNNISEIWIITYNLFKRLLMGPNDKNSSPLIAGHWSQGVTTVPRCNLMQK